MNLRDALDVKVGSTPVNKIYKGTYKVWDRNKIALEGYCKQETTKGKQLLESIATTDISQGVEFIQNKNGTVTINGKNNGTGNSYFHLGNITLPAGTYYGIKKQEGVQLVVYVAGNYYDLSEVNLTLAEQKTTTDIYLQIKNNQKTYDNFIFYPMIANQNITIDDFEPYTGGQPSPSPDYPQEIEVMQGRQVVNGRDLVNLSIIDSVPSISNGQMVSYNGAASSDFFKIDKTKQNVISLEYSINPDVYVLWYDENKNYLGYNLNITDGYLLENSNYYLQAKYIKLRVDQIPRIKKFTINEQYTVDLKSKNLYNVKDTYKKDNKCVLDNEDYITVEFDNSAGQSGQYFNYYTKASDDLKPNTDYYLVVEIKQVTGNGLLKAISNDLTYDISQTNSFFAKYFYELSNGQKIVQKITTIADFSNSKSMLRTYIGNSAGQSGSITFRLSVLEEQPTVENFNYEPYYDYKLAGIGDYKDNFYTDKGKWYLEKNVEKVVLDGSEKWFRSSVANNYAYFSAVDKRIIESADSLCNYFQYTNIYKYDIIGFDTINVHKTFFHLRIGFGINTAITDVTNCKNWLAEHNLEVYCPLATPTVEEITAPTLINQLNALYQAM